MRMFLVAAAAAMLVTTPANAGRQLKMRDTLTVAPDKSYLLFRTVGEDPDAFDISFLRELSAAEQQQARAALDEAFARDEARRARRQESEVAALQRRGVNEAAARRHVAAERGEREPSVTAPLLPLNMIHGPVPRRWEGAEVGIRSMSGRALDRGERLRTYLIEVAPGGYVVAGIAPRDMSGGTCLCMGSVRFDAPAGQVVDLGTFRFNGDAVPDDRRAAAGFLADPELSLRPTLMAIEPSGMMTERPQHVAGATVVPARYTASGRFPNLYGMMVSRLAPIPGVLAYDRDRPFTPTATAAGSVAPTTITASAPR
ncbi:hypothetical protein GGR88_000725 [Sphingomonas jejuensis]|uniref:Uncharacterized protein n=1 Tax=Sphingomonas jejuensis TaxID=904715 RepID=A0ABX0XIU0_9SPHN|nr:hypothetical protein [Sphingomonas jejuensis]NJC33251.1 hypothetical protein [Sphingomonas jejuensis]